MKTTRPRSPCATCKEVYEVEWPEAVAFYCGGEIPPGERVLIEHQRLKHPRGNQALISEGPLPCCPKGHIKQRPKTRKERRVEACAEAKAALERAINNSEFRMQTEELTEKGGGDAVPDRD